MTHLTQERLKELVIYLPEQGVFIWNLGRPGCSTGKPCGTLKTSGYVIVTLDRRLHRAHRLAWFYMTGDWPEHDVDHINLCRSDNKWSNLRLATRGQNMLNSGIRRDNTSGYKNVYFYKETDRYYVHITINTVRHSYGPFDDADSANEVAVVARAKLAGEYCNHGHVKPSNSKVHWEIVG